MVVCLWVPVCISVSEELSTNNRFTPSPSYIGQGTSRSRLFTDHDIEWTHKGIIMGLPTTLAMSAVCRGTYPAHSVLFYRYIFLGHGRGLGYPLSDVVFRWLGTRPTFEYSRWCKRCVDSPKAHRTLLIRNLAQAGYSGPL
jgi:hypothetical protein